MKNRRGFLQLLGLAPAAALAPRMLDSGKATDILPVRIPAVQSGVYSSEPTGLRYLGLAQLKNEGDPTSFDPGAPDFSDEIERFAKEAFGRKELYEWPDNPEYWEEDEA